MKIDTLFPPPPQFNQPPLRCDDITPARQRAIDRAAKIAEVAEDMVGMSLEGELPFHGAARGLAAYAVATALTSATVRESMAALLSAEKLRAGAADELPGVMLIHPRHCWGVLGPMRGDVVIYADGHCAVVTKPLCMGCQHFEAVTLGGEPPQIAKVTQWLSAVKWKTEPCSEDYQCGWNRGVADFQKNVTSTITASEGRTGRAYAEYIEGYLASQENLLIQRADLRESGVLVIG